MLCGSYIGMILVINMVSLTFHELMKIISIVEVMSLEGNCVKIHKVDFYQKLFYNTKRNPNIS